MKFLNKGISLKLKYVIALAVAFILLLVAFVAIFSSVGSSFSMRADASVQLKKEIASAQDSLKSIQTEYDQSSALLDECTANLKQLILQIMNIKSIKTRRATILYILSRLITEF